MVIYIHSEPEPDGTACTSITNPGNEAACTSITNIPSNKLCTFVDTETPCSLTDKPTEQNPTTSKKSASTSTNSSDILNIFKITLALLIVLTIL